MLAIPGAVSGQTSRTGHGAWSTTNRGALPRLLGPSRDRSDRMGRAWVMGLTPGIAVLSGPLTVPGHGARRFYAERAACAG